MGTVRAHRYFGTPGRASPLWMTQDVDNTSRKDWVGDGSMFLAKGIARKGESLDDKTHIGP